MKILSLYKDCHPERSEHTRVALVLAESKDPREVDSIRIASRNSPRVRAAPFAARTSRSAQDDSFRNVHTPRPERPA